MQILVNETQWMENVFHAHHFFPINVPDLIVNSSSVHIIREKNTCFHNISSEYFIHIFYFTDITKFLRKRNITHLNLSYFYSPIFILVGNTSHYWRWICSEYHFKLSFKKILTYNRVQHYLHPFLFITDTVESVRTKSLESYSLRSSFVL